MENGLTNLMQFVERGGIIVEILIVLNIIGFTVILWKLIIMKVTQLRSEYIAHDTIAFIKKHNLHFSKELLKNGVAYQIQKLERGLGIVKTIAVISPLLGLLGTVVGVLQAFDTISSQGMGDPSLFSSSIAIALITTIAGLVVAIPHYIAYNYFNALLDTIEVDLEKEILEKL